MSFTERLTEKLPKSGPACDADCCDSALGAARFSCVAAQPARSRTANGVASSRGFMMRSSVLAAESKVHHAIRTCSVNCWTGTVARSRSIRFAQSRGTPCLNYLRKSTQMRLQICGLSGAPKQKPRPCGRGSFVPTQFKLGLQLNLVRAHRSVIIHTAACRLALQVLGGELAFFARCRAPLGALE